MKYRELVILLPCHSLEDFPTHNTGDDADGLLAAWTALFHPAFLAAAGSTPQWYRVDAPPTELAERLIVIPSASTQQLPTGFAMRAKDAGACVVRGKARREEIVALGLESLDGGSTVPTDLAADFLALGFAFLQVQLLTRQMRYSSNLDEVHFKNQILAGATAAVSGDETTAREKLAACFNLLGEERDHYYSVDAYLLDLTLVAPTTIGKSLRDELDAGSPLNLLLAAETLTELRDKEPESLTAIQQALAAKTVTIVGGEAVERALPLLPCEAILGDLWRGAAVYEALLGCRPGIFGRRRFGLVPVLPTILSRCGFRGALHVTLEDGRFPEGSQTKTRWEGCDGTAIDAIARVPLDVAKPETFLGYARRLGESMDSDHVATLCLAHWPGQRSVWYDDLRRIAKYSHCLGKFATFDTYFRDTDLPSHLDRFEADRYRSPYLKQAVIRRETDPISRWVRYWRRRAAAETAQALHSLADFVTNRTEPRDDLLTAVDLTSETADAPGLDDRLADAVTAATSRLADALPAGKPASTAGYLALNPFTFARRVQVESSELSASPAAAPPVYAAAHADSRQQFVVDVPPLGFAWVAPGPAAKPAKKKEPLLVEEGQLRNDFFEVTINSVTGTLQSIREYNVRGNRLSQQLAYRLPGPRPRTGDEYQDPDETVVYSVMAADSVDVTAATTVYGEITAKGRLLDRDGKLLANFRQKYQLWRGSRVLVLDIELDPVEEPKADPWNSYYACRFAWADESATMYRSVNQTRQRTDIRQFEAPQYIELETEKNRTVLLSGGLPYHRRVGYRMLDTLLITRGERERRFRVGIGLDVAYPLQAAMQFVAPPTGLIRSTPPANGSGWLFHLDAKNLTATHWEPLLVADRMEGFRVRLLETSGRPARAKLSTFRPVGSARVVDFRGESLADCALEDGQIRLEIAAHEWCEIEARWRT